MNFSGVLSVLSVVSSPSLCLSGPVCGSASYSEDILDGLPKVPIRSVFVSYILDPAFLACASLASWFRP